MHAMPTGRRLDGRYYVHRMVGVNDCAIDLPILKVDIHAYCYSMISTIYSIRKEEEVDVIHSVRSGFSAHRSQALLISYGAIVITSSV